MGGKRRSEERYEEKCAEAWPWPCWAEKFADGEVGRSGHGARLMLEEKFIGIEECPSEIFEAGFELWLSLNEIDGEFSFLLDGFTASDGQEECIDGLFDGSLGGDERADPIIFGANGVMEHASIEEFDSHPEIGFVGSFADADGSAFGLPERLEEVDFDEVGTGELGGLSADGEIGEFALEVHCLIDGIEQLFGREEAWDLVGEVLGIVSV